MASTPTESTAPAPLGELERLTPDQVQMLNAALIAAIKRIGDMVDEVGFQCETLWPRSLLLMRLESTRDALLAEHTSLCHLRDLIRAAEAVTITLAPKAAEPRTQPEARR